MNFKKVIDLRVQKFGFDFYCDIAKRIIAERKNNEMSQKQLADVSNIALSVIERMENVQRRIGFNELAALTKALHCPVEHLIGAKPLYGNEDCLFIVYSEEYSESCKKNSKDVLADGNRGLYLYIKAKSFEQAVFEWEKKFPYRTPYWSGRDRAIVELVGIPVSKSELTEASRPSIESNQNLTKTKEAHDDIPNC